MRLCRVVDGCVQSPWILGGVVSLLYTRDGLAKKMLLLSTVRSPRKLLTCVMSHIDRWGGARKSAGSLTVRIFAARSLGEEGGRNKSNRGGKEEERRMKVQ